MEFGFITTTKKKKQLMPKKKSMERDVVLPLEKGLRTNGGIVVDAIKRFGAKELKAATDNYGDHRFIGEGSNGIVYKGTLADKHDVAIKQFHRFDPESQLEQLINDIANLGKMQHQNVVQILGCCLETEVPLLVYEFSSNGTLYDHIHNGTSGTMMLSWDSCLRIAQESASAFAYLHTDTGMFVVHGDVKSTKILLDELYTAKIAYFGTSKLVSLGDSNVPPVVNRMLGYLDPEYFLTCNLIIRVMCIALEWFLQNF